EPRSTDHGAPPQERDCQIVAGPPRGPMHKRRDHRRILSVHGRVWQTLSSAFRTRYSGSMTGMRRARTVVAFALLAVLSGVWIATLRSHHEAVGAPAVRVEYTQVGRGRVRTAYLAAIGR